MRILRVAQKIYPDIVGGGPYHAHALSRDQAALGHDVTVLTIRHNEENPRREEHDGYTVIRRDPTLNILGNDISLGLGKKMWDVAGFDVVHAHSHLYFATNVAALQSRFSNVPFVITNHGLYSQSAPRWLFDWYLKTLGRWTFNQAELVFTYTEPERDVLRNRGINSAIEVVRNGVDCERFTPEGGSSNRIGNKGLVVLFVGRLVEGKRPLDAVETLVRLRESVPSVELYIVGDGPLREEVVTVAEEHDIRDAVTLLGQVSYNQMPAIYRAADVLLLTSQAEGFPRTVLEALSTETPVVTSELEQLGEITEEVGKAVPIGDINGFASAIDEILASPEASRGKRGREIVAERYTWQQTVRQTTNHLKRVASSESIEDLRNEARKD